MSNVVFFLPFFFPFFIPLSVRPMGIILLLHISSKISLRFAAHKWLYVNSVFLSSTMRFHLNFQPRKINTRNRGDKENKRSWKTNFWQWQRGSGPRDTRRSRDLRHGGTKDRRVDWRTSTQHLTILETTSLLRNIRSAIGMARYIAEFVRYGCPSKCFIKHRNMKT